MLYPKHIIEIFLCSHYSAGPYSTTIIVNGHADQSANHATSTEPKGEGSSEILLTPTEAAAAGDVTLTFDDQADHGKSIEIREPAVLTDSENMGNKTSVDVTPVKLTAIGDKGPVQKGMKKGVELQ